MATLAKNTKPTSNSSAEQSFNWEDPLLLSEMLSEDERIIDNAAKVFCEGELLPGITMAHRHEKFDRKIMNRFGENGFLGSTIPEEYGGAGLSYVNYGLIAKNVESIDSGYRSAMSVQSSLVMHPIYAFGTEAQRLKYLPDLASGKKVGAFGLTEPDHGSDPSSMQTSASTVPGGYVLNGAKMWISNSPIADIFVVWAKESGQIRGFVERSMDGLSTPKLKGSFL